MVTDLAACSIDKVMNVSFRAVQEDCGFFRGYELLQHDVLKYLVKLLRFGIGNADV
jgi:hypothetical protein